ncbi:hypothetical protein MVEN_00599600 [Mycena venus]|uniref:Uncharacterized protein n=1 Tax=Mycena venus TaxID=2733690 RepID=A0A8H7D895_9AGAR|nr:hypothetical protein MVEN_00599600 [Mycena venus]
MFSDILCADILYYCAAAAILGLFAHSIPFSWHFRLFRPLVFLKIRLLLFKAELLLYPKDKRSEIEQMWLESLYPLGVEPFDREVVYKTWATLDDCDFRLHISNSSYAKNLDACRLKSAVASLPGFIRAGGWIGLGGLHFLFLSEIPLFARIEQRVRFASWDNKWMYVIVRVVTLPTAAQKKKGERFAKEQTVREDSPSSIHGPSILELPQRFRPDAVEPDGAIVHCIAISDMVMKIGRVTVPPALAFACEGFSKPSPDPSAPYSATKPPPHWKHVQAIWKSGGAKAMRDFLSGGWKSVPEKEKWWDDALSGPVESKRLDNLKMVRGIRAGMEGFKHSS